MGIATVAAEVFCKFAELPHDEQNLPSSAICEEHFGQVSIAIAYSMPDSSRRFSASFAA